MNSLSLRPIVRGQATTKQHGQVALQYSEEEIELKKNNTQHNWVGHGMIFLASTSKPLEREIGLI